MMSAGKGPAPLGRATAARMTPLSVFMWSHETESGGVRTGAWETLGFPDIPLSGDGDAVRRAHPAARNDTSIANDAIRPTLNICMIRAIIYSVVMSGLTSGSVAAASPTLSTATIVMPDGQGPLIHDLHQGGGSSVTWNQTICQRPARRSYSAVFQARTGGRRSPRTVISTTDEYRRAATAPYTRTAIESTSHT